MVKAIRMLQLGFYHQVKNSKMQLRLSKLSKAGEIVSVYPISFSYSSADKSASNSEMSDMSTLIIQPSP